MDNLKSTSQRPTQLPGRELALPIGLLCSVAIAITSYLVWIAMTSSKIAGCGGGHFFDCNDVISSRWSRWLGIPVSLLALSLYITLLSAVTVGSRRKVQESTRRMVWKIAIVLGLSTGLAGIWFISLQALVVKHFCTYCLAAHSCGLVISSILVWKRPLGRAMMARLLLISSFGLGLVVSGQLLFKPITYQIIEHELPAADSLDTDVFEFAPPAETPEFPMSGDGSSPRHAAENGSAHDLSVVLENTNWRHGILAIVCPTSLVHGQLATGGDSPEATTTGKEYRSSPNSVATSAAKRHILSVLGGTIKLDVAQWPMLGKPDAKYAFVEMFDYTCDHCRRTHAAIAEAKRQLGDDLAVVMLPVPLNTRCNSAIAVTGVRMAEACEIANLAVAVWRLDAARFGEFHEYLMTTPGVATYSAAKFKAAELVGDDRLAAELATNVSAKYIAQHVELYRRAGAGSVPKLLFPGTTVVGEYTSADGLIQIIRKQPQNH